MEPKIRTVRRHKVELVRDFYGEHFDEPGDIKVNYMVQIYGDTFDEDEDRKVLAKRISQMAADLNKIALRLMERK